MFNVKYDQLKHYFYDNNGPLNYLGFYSRDNTPDIHGSIYYRNGNELYKGDIKMGSLQGYGVYRTMDGVKIYEGQFKNSVPHYKGTLYDEEYGDVLYEGSWFEGSKDGTGVIYWNNGTVKYEGSLVKEKKEGYGNLWDENKHLVYCGYWKDDKRDGFGKSFFSSGSLSYIGYFRNDKYDGKGEEYHHNGKVKFKGYWKNNQKEGMGITSYNTGTTRFMGMTSDSYLNSLLNSKIILFTNRGTKIFEGYFREGRKHGFGVLFSSDFTQVIYRGGWNLDMKDGYGTVYYEKNNTIKECNRKYQGNWEYDCYHGKGIEFWENGNKKYKGNWDSGTLDGNVYEYNRNGDLIKQSFWRLDQCFNTHYY